MSRHASTVDLLGDADAEPDREDARSGDGEDDPRDRWGLCYLIFLLAGAGTMFPWNVFITERAYFDVRLFAPPFTPALANSFESVFGMAYLLTNACAQYAMVVTRIANRLSPKAMLPAPLFAMAGGLALTGCVTYARHMSGDATMALTLITLLVLGVLTAVVQGGSFALASVLPPVYNQALMSGQAVAGIATAIIALLSTAAGGEGAEGGADTAVNGKEARAIASQAAAYFFTSAFTVFACAAATWFLEYTPFYKRRSAAAAEREARTSVSMGHSRPSHQRLDSDATTVPLLDPWGDSDGEDEEGGAGVGREGRSGMTFTSDDGSADTHVTNDPEDRWFYRAAVALTFTVTLCVFPAVTSSVCSARNGATSPPCQSRAARSNSRLFGDLFVPTLFLVFNAADFCGRAFANVYPRGAPRGKCVFGCALARLGLVPPLLACNVVVPGRWNFPRFLSRFDAAPFVLVAALAFTNGHLASVCMMYGPSRVAHHTRADEGVKMSFACIAGLGAGSVLSYALNASMQA